MSSTIYTAPTANYLSKTLNGSIGDSDDTITLNNTTSMQAPGYIVIDRTNSAGTATPDNREVVSYTGISGSDLTGCARGADGSTNRAHADGAIVETMPTVGMWNSLATIVDQAVTGDGYLKAIGSPVSIARMQIIQEAVTSIASITRLEGPFAKVSSALMSIVTISGHLTISGASVSGAFPAATQTRSVWMGANEMRDASEGSPAGAVIDTMTRVWALDAASQEGIAAGFIVPNDWSSGSITAKVYWAKSTSASGNVKWRWRRGAIAAGEAIGAAGNDEITVSSSDTSGVLQIDSFSAFTVSAGDFIGMAIVRVAADAADTYGADAYLVGVEIEYTSVQ